MLKPKPCTSKKRERSVLLLQYNFFNTIFENFRAMQSAGQWYKQNRKLKRQSAALMQKLPPQTIQEWDTLDAVDTGISSFLSLFDNYVIVC